MTERPPTPSTPTPTASIAAAAEERTVATTSQLTASIEDALGLRLNDAIFEDLLLELDRRNYLEWETISRGGDYVWDLSDAPERLGEALAEALVARMQAWLEETD